MEFIGLATILFDRGFSLYSPRLEQRSNYTGHLIHQEIFGYTPQQEDKIQNYEQYILYFLYYNNSYWYSRYLLFTKKKRDKQTDGKREF